MHVRDNHTVTFYNVQCISSIEAPKQRSSIFIVGSINGKHTFHIGILLPGTELLDSPVRREFHTGSFQTVFM